MPARRRPLALRRALACFGAAYVIVTVLAATITGIYAGVRHTAAADRLATSPVEKPSFADTVPYHVLVMLVVWPVFAWLYFRTARRVGRRAQVRETALLSVSWTVAAMIVDFVGFVLIKNAWSLTPHQFYVDYQPWISLIYLSILASPWIRLALLRRTASTTG
jgi:hypothetical protein